MPATKAPWFARSAIPPLTLLTVLTSFAFNHSLITSQRREEVRRHRTQVEVLQDLLDYRTHQLYTLRPPSGLFSWLGSSRSQTQTIEADENVIIRRLHSVGLDPRAYGFTLPASLPVGKLNQGPRETDWSEIFFGSKESRTSLTDKFSQVVAGIRTSFSAAPATHHTVSPHELEELARIEQEWTAALSTDTQLSQPSS